MSNWKTRGDPRNQTKKIPNDPAPPCALFGDRKITSEMDYRPDRNFYADGGLRRCVLWRKYHLFSNDAQREHVTFFDATLSTPDVTQTFPRHDLQRHWP